MEQTTLLSRPDRHSIPRMLQMTSEQLHFAIHDYELRHPLQVFSWAQQPNNKLVSSFCIVTRSDKFSAAYRLLQYYTALEDRYACRCSSRSYQKRSYIPLCSWWQCRRHFSKGRLSGKVFDTSLASSESFVVINKKGIHSFYSHVTCTLLSSLLAWLLFRKFNNPRNQNDIHTDEWLFYFWMD